jgi:hypothetical protein
VVEWDFRRGGDGFSMKLFFFFFFFLLFFWLIYESVCVSSLGNAFVFWFWQVG